MDGADQAAVKRPMRSVSVVVPTESCIVCSKTALVMESIKVDSKNFHKACFRCTTCNNVLRLGNFAALQGNYYCKPHFKELFRLKGNYDEGFGREQHKTKWISGERGESPAPGSPAPGSPSVAKVTDDLAEVKISTRPASVAGIASVPAVAKTHVVAPSPLAASPVVTSATAPVTPNTDTPEPAAAAAAPVASVSASSSPAPSAADILAKRAIRDQKSLSLSAVNVKNAACFVCDKTVYQMDKVTADGHDYHKTCFRCAECNNVLRLGNFAALAGKMYCKPHFKQLFKLKGNYDEGFGREQHKKLWVDGSDKEVESVGA